VTNCEAWILPKHGFQEILKFFPLKSKIQLHHNQGDLISSLGCRYHEKLPVIRLKKFPEDYPILFHGGFPLDDYELKEKALQVHFRLEFLVESHFYFGAVLPNGLKARD
jgi:hypothetical protein